MIEDAPDGELVRRIAAAADGVRAAEAELCRRFAPRAQLYGLRHLRNAELARDLAQSVMLAVLEAARAGRVQEPNHVARFVLGTCRHLCRRARELGARELAHEHAALEHAFTPELEWIDTGALVRCLAALEPRARSVVHLSFHEQKSAEEIARELELSAGNVRVLRHRAVADLRRCLDRRREGAP